jgi:TP901 family phage tail tape measure protein
MAAANLDIKIGYSVDSVQKILDNFKTVVKGSDLDKVLIPDQQKVIAAFEGIKSQIAAGVDISNIDFKSAFGVIEEYAKKAAFVVGEEFSKELKGYSDKVIDTQDQLVKKQQEISEINAKMSDFNQRKKDLRETYGMQTSTNDPVKLQERINQLEAQEQEDPLGDGGQREKRIEFYKNWLALLKEIEKTMPGLKQDRMKSEEQARVLQVELMKQQAVYAKELKKLGVDESIITKALLGSRDDLNKVYEKGYKAKSKLNKETSKQNDLEDEEDDNNNRGAKSFGARIAQTFSFGLVIAQLRKAFQESIKTVMELDKAMTDAAIVTNMNRKEAWELLGSYQALARGTGLATSEISGIVVEFLKQGRNVKEAMELAEVAAKSAKVAGISAQEAVDYLTSAVNGFGLAATQAEEIADKFAAVSAASATDFEELAVAMSKVAPVAKVAGVGIDFMMGVLAKGLETTREAPENIGTAFKTIFARMREVTDIGKATEDGMSLNRVEKALESIGVPLRGVTGQFRSLEDVLIEVGNKWDTLTSIEQAYIATSLAGTRQQPRLLAIFNDFARTKELIELSSESTGALAFQHVEYMMGAEAALAQLKTAWEGFIMAFTETEIIIDSIRFLGDVVNGLTNFITSLGTSAEVMNGALVATAVIFGVLNGKMIANLLINGLLVAAKFLLTKNTEAYNSALAISKTGLDANTINEKRHAFALLFKTITQKKVIVTQKAATATVWADVKAKLANIAVTMAWALIIAVVVGLLAVLAFNLLKAGESTESLAESIAENSKNLDELNNKEKDIKKLVDRFNELNKITNKSAGELEEMKNIATELSKVEIDGQQFILTRKDVSGDLVFDDAEYERLLAFTEMKRQELLTENIALVNQALDKTFKTYQDYLNVFNNPVIMNAARKIGYDYALNFINGQTDALDDSKSKAREAILRFTKDLDISKFSTETFTFKGYKQGDMGWATDQTFNSLKEMYDANLRYMDSSISSLKINIKDRYDTFEKFLNAINSGDFSPDIKVSNIFNEAELQAYSEKISAILLTAYDTAEKEIAKTNASTTLTQKQKIDAIFNTQIQSFKNAEAAIRSQFASDPVLMNYSLDMLKTSMQDEAILDMLINRDNIRMNVIVEMSMNMNIQEIEDVFDKLKKNMNDFAGPSFREFLLDNQATKNQASTIARMSDEDLRAAYSNYLDDYQESLDNLNQGDILFNQANSADAIENAFALMYNNTATGVLTGVKEMRDALVATRKYTEEEIKNMIDDVISTINLVSPEVLAGTIKEQAKLLQNVFKLGEDIEKGDLSKFTEMVGEFGYQQVMGILQGSDAAMKKFLNDQKDETMASIDESIAALEAYYKAQDANMTREQIAAAMTDSEREQYLLLTLIRDTYEQIVDLEQMREFRLKNVKELQKEISDILKLQESLSALNVQDTGFVALLDRIVQIKREAATTTLTKQLGEDIENLKEFIDGTTFAFDPDSDLDAASAAIEGTITTLTELITLQTEAYKQQEKIIKDRYKTESDAIKKAHDERWQEIEYTNEITEAEENLVIARRQLEALTISNASRGQLEEAQKNLEKLRQERDKIIEERMLEEAQKQIEIDMQEELANELGDLNDSIEHYTQLLATLINRIVALNPTWTPTSTVTAPSADQPDTDTDTEADEPDDTEPPAPSTPDAPTNATFAELSAKIDPLSEQIQNLTNNLTLTSPSVVATGELTSSNILLKTSIDDLRGTIQGWSVQIVNGSTNNQPGDMTGNEG